MSKRDHIRVHGIRRKRIDPAKLGRAVIELAQAQAEKDAQAEHEARQASQAEAEPQRPQANKPRRRPRRDASEERR